MTDCVASNPHSACALEESWRGLSAVTLTAVGANAFGRVVRAVIRRIDVRTEGAELLADPRREIEKLLLCVVASRDARLIGDHEHEESPPIGPLDRLTGAVNPGEVLGLVNPTPVDVERAIAIEEESPGPWRQQRIRSRSSQIV